MPYYYENKDEALLAGALYTDKFTIRVELEPYNGWVLVLKPKDLRAFQEPLFDLLKHAEVDLQGYPILRQRPADYRRPPPAPAPKPKAREPEEDVKPTWTPGAPLPW